MEINEIMEVLPHRPPFLLIDRVLEMDMESKHIVAVKNLSAGEDFFRGHFPRQPIYPGVLQIETMAQAAGVLLNKVAGFEGRIAYLTSVDKARFRKLCGPGDSLLVKAKLEKVRSFLCKVSASIEIDGEVASECEISFAFGRD